MSKIHFSRFQSAQSQWMLCPEGCGFGSMEHVSSDCCVTHRGCDFLPQWEETQQHPLGPAHNVLCCAVPCWSQPWWHCEWKSPGAAVSWAHKGRWHHHGTGKESRAAGSYYAADKRIPRRCARWWNNCTLGMNNCKAKSEVFSGLELC